MAPKKKTVFKAFGYRQCDDFAAYLNHMARQGWHFKEWRGGLVFEEGQPEEAHYAVEIFTKAEETDVRPEPDTQEFAEYCEAAGWTLVDAKRKFCIFKRIRADAVPIMTDTERFENIVQAERPFVNRTLWVSAMWVAMKLIELISLFDMRAFSSTQVSLTALWLTLFLMALVHWGQFQLWKHLCRQQLEQGQPLFFGRSRRANSERWYTCLYSLVSILHLGYLAYIGQSHLVIYMLVFMVGLVFISFLVAWFRPDSTTSALIVNLVPILLVLVLLIAVSVDSASNAQLYTTIDPPLTFQDMDIDAEIQDVRYSREESSVFGTCQRANLDYGPEYLFYDIYRSDHPWVIRKLWKDEVKHKTKMTRTDCTAAWGAVEAFRYGESNYLVRYEDAFWNIHYSFEEPLTQEQIDSIIATLRGD